jgi:hypothetical protein
MFSSPRLAEEGTRGVVGVVRVVSSKNPWGFLNIDSKLKKWERGGMIEMF